MSTRVLVGCGIGIWAAVAAAVAVLWVLREAVWARLPAVPCFLLPSDPWPQLHTIGIDTARFSAVDSRYFDQIKVTKTVFMHSGPQISRFEPRCDSVLMNSHRFGLFLLENNIVLYGN